jgi:hypothetical protein
MPPARQRALGSCLATDAGQWFDKVKQRSRLSNIDREQKREERRADQDEPAP